MSEIKEEFRDVKGFEGVYMISNNGRVKSLERYIEWRGTLKLKKEMYLKASPNSDGYLQVVLYYNKKKKSCKVHKLIAEAFMNHTPCGLDVVVDHINNIKTDNRIENLQLVSNRYNATKDKVNKSGYMGVCWDKSRNKWLVGLRYGGKKVNLGRYSNIEDASVVANRAYVLVANEINPIYLK